jgi:hypothetical protein
MRTLGQDENPTIHAHRDGSRRRELQHRAAVRDAQGVVAGDGAEMTAAGLHNRPGLQN